jgi:hypothetical protein
MSLVREAAAPSGHVVAVASQEEATMNTLWHWLKDRWLEHQALTLQAPSHHAHPLAYAPIIASPEKAYLRWLIGGEPWL